MSTEPPLSVSDDLPSSSFLLPPCRSHSPSLLLQPHDHSRPNQSFPSCSSSSSSGSSSHSITMPRSLSSSLASSETSFLSHNGIVPPEVSSPLARSSAQLHSGLRRTCSSSSTSQRVPYGRHPSTPRALYASLTPRASSRRSTSSASACGPGSSAMGQSPSGSSSGMSNGSKPPREFMIARMRALAPQFWGNTATSDCILLVPHPPDAESRIHSPAGFSSNTPSSLTSSREDQSSESEAKRRRSAPVDTLVVAYRLHKDYLTHQSSFFAKLFASPPVQTSSSTSLPPTSTPSCASSSFEHPTSDNARPPPTSSSTPNRNATYLVSDLPDPSSLGLIIHFLYWGREAVVEQALVGGKVGWQGLFRNIQHLGLDNSIKVVAARWWRQWIKPTLALPSLSSSSSTSSASPRPAGKVSSAIPHPVSSTVSSPSNSRAGGDTGWLLELGLEGLKL